MSHCPGSTLEDWLTDWWRVLDVEREHGSGIRWMYVGQLIFSKDQFKKLVQIYEPFRAEIELRLNDYSEEENGSWRDYCGYAFDSIPEEIHTAAQVYIKTIEDQVEKTKGWMDGMNKKPMEEVVQALRRQGFEKVEVTLEEFNVEAVQVRIASGISFEDIKSLMAVTEEFKARLTIFRSGNDGTSDLIAMILKHELGKK